MNSKTLFSLLAALTDAGVLFHDVFGVIGLLVLLVFGIFLHKRQNRLIAKRPQSSGDNAADRAFGKVQAWVLYWVVVAGTVAFFFVMPRATSQRRQSLPGESTVEQKVP